MSDDIPEIDVAPARRTFWQRVSVVWLVPIVGLIVALGVAWQTWSSQGPLLTITFDEALGVKERETELKYRDVVVGYVEKVKFSSDLGHVEVSIRVDKDVAPFVDNDAEFWVVRPEVSARGVSGLETVLSGVFIEGVWDSNPSEFVSEHAGLEGEPILKSGESGTVVTLRADSATALVEGTMITYKGIEAGRIGKPELVPGLAKTQAPAVVYAPFDRYITSSTRFWDTSGFSFSIGAGGANLDFSSLASLVAGGIAFDTLVSGGIPPRGTPVFDVYETEDEARLALFEEQRGNSVYLSIVFDENATGLAVGAPVQFNGILVGEVTEVSGIVDPLRFRDQRVRLQVIVEVGATPLGMPEAANEDDVIDFFATQVAEGLRARLGMASIITGGLRIELVTVDDPEPGILERTADPYPAIPTTESQIADAGATAQGVLQRISDLPVEELMGAAINFLNASTELVGDDELGQIPTDVRAILEEVRQIIGSDEIQNIPDRVNEILEGAQIATDGVADIAQSFDEAGAVDRILAAIDATGAAADSVVTSVEGVPDLIDSLTATAQTAQELQLDELIDRVSAIVATADELLHAPGVSELPANLNANLAELRLILADLQDGGAIENLNATMAAAQDAADAIARSADTLPALARKLETVLDVAEGTLADYDGNSDLNRAARQALSDIARAAKAIESLSRAIERKPNSLLLGK